MIPPVIINISEVEMNFLLCYPVRVTQGDRHTHTHTHNHTDTHTDTHTHMSWLCLVRPRTNCVAQQDTIYLTSKKSMFKAKPIND